MNVSLVEDENALADVMERNSRARGIHRPTVQLALGDHDGQQKGQRRRRIENDSLPADQWETFCRGWSRNLLTNVDGALYICMSC